MSDEKAFREVFGDQFTTAQIKAFLELMDNRALHAAGKLERSEREYQLLEREQDIQFKILHERMYAHDIKFEELKKDIEGIRKEIQGMKNELEGIRKDIVALQLEIVSLKTGQEALSDKFNAKVERTIRSYFQWMVVLIIALAALLTSFHLAG